MLECFLEDLFPGPGCIIQQFLRGGISFNQVLQFAEEHLHKDGLGANPSAKQAPKGCSKENDEHDKSDHHQTKNEKILWPEHLSKDDELGLRNIEQEQRPALHRNEGQ